MHILSGIFIVILPLDASLSTVACPLLLFWPLVCEVRGSRAGKASGEGGEDAVMEMRLREKPELFSSALLQLSTRYLFLLGLQVQLLTYHNSRSKIIIYNFVIKSVNDIADPNPSCSASPDGRTLLCHSSIFLFACLPGLRFSVCSCYPQETPNGVVCFRTQVSA